MRSAPTLNICMTPFSSVAMLEKLALLRIAFCKAPVLSKASWRRTSVMPRLSMRDGVIAMAFSERAGEREAAPTLCRQDAEPLYARARMQPRHHDADGHAGHRAGRAVGREVRAGQDPLHGDAAADGARDDPGPDLLAVSQPDGVRGGRERRHHRRD